MRRRGRRETRRWRPSRYVFVSFFGGSSQSCSAFCSAVPAAAAAAAPAPDAASALLCCCIGLDDARCGVPPPSKAPEAVPATQRCSRKGCIRECVSCMTCRPTQGRSRLHAGMPQADLVREPSPFHHMKGNKLFQCSKPSVNVYPCLPGLGL